MFSKSKLIIRNWTEYVMVLGFVEKNSEEIKVFMCVMRESRNYTFKN